MKRPDLTPILIKLNPNDWIEVVEKEDGEEREYEGRFTEYTKDHIKFWNHIGNCEFDGEVGVKLENVVSIKIVEDPCDLRGPFQK